MHHADAGCERCARMTAGKRLPEDLDRTFVGAVMAKQDRYQRGLSRTVFAKQREYLAAVKRQGNAVVGEQRSKALGDARKPEDLLPAQ